MPESPPIFSLLQSSSSPIQPSLDVILKEQFERCRQAGSILRNDPLDSDVLRKSLPGTLGLISEFEPSLFGHKRPATVSSHDMDEPFNADKFHFNKVGPEEVLVLIHFQEQEETTHHPILVNVSPLMYGHGLLIPWGDEGLPQQLIPKAVTLAIQVLQVSASNCEFCIGFNSLGAFSSVNHLHLHVLFPSELDHEARLGGEDPLMGGRKDFPIAYAPIEMTVTRGYEDCQVDLLDWMIPCFSFRQCTTLQAAVSRFVRFLHTQQIPHNVLFLKEDSSTRVVVIPRQPQHHFDANKHGFNAALGEISGMLIAKTRHQFEAFEEARVRQIMVKHVACEEGILTKILNELRGVSA
ncbi:GDP-D-glucose phosphorylase 1 [Seminavis robusta]|uniref:GDP-D-glucose phosphorylase 1 n=1 Tax=Seminavis robusta TaxID=568900 RepID=A0A9N8EKU7_9STRA|nr:GDP-D-glucose phosphorylase 1 [Seminavis robusta]|eukprot:Sro1375_g267390.1 GDP-D-glucose phosphorylase 1 (352) ;mRNA; r:21188-22243